MIYETAVVVRAEAGDNVIKALKEDIKKTLESSNSEILVEDDWGMKTFAQPTEKGERNGTYIYYMFKADGQSNAELERRFRINENVSKFIVVKLGDDKNIEEYKKNYKNPNSRTSDDFRRSDAEKEKKLFAKRKSCWFSAKKTEPDWKDPSTYSWLVNEFGKISPARVTGLRPKYQRAATTAIKRGRAMGLISYMSNHTLR